MAANYRGGSIRGVTPQEAEYIAAELIEMNRDRQAALDAARASGQPDPVDLPFATLDAYYEFIVNQNLLLAMLARRHANRPKLRNLKERLDRLDDAKLDELDVLARE